MHNILARYKADSGEAINLQKSGIYFSKSVVPQDRATVSHILKVTSPLNTSRYLGIPSLIGKSKEFFGYLRDRLRKRLQGWQSKLLSHQERKF